MKKEETFMNVAIEEAKKAFELDEVPVGAVIIYKDQIIAKAFNRKDHECCVLDHAELIAIREASHYLKNWRLNDCSIYITLKPCPMCASAIKQSRISYIYYGCDLEDKELSSLVDKILNKKDYNPIPCVNSGVLAFESQELLKTFFRNRRDK